VTADLYDAVHARVLDALAAEVPGLDPQLALRVETTPARDPEHGDLATNAALIATKAAGVPPPRLAAALAVRLREAPEVLGAEPAGPGFVNLRLRPAALQAVLPTVLKLGEGYGDCDAGRGRRVNVEFVSANPSGPIHVGHARGAVVGDALANLLAKAGYRVSKEYYVNDAGAQVAALAWAAYWRYLQALGTRLTQEEFASQVPGGLQYGGDYLVPVGEALAASYEGALAGPGATVADPALWLPAVRDFTVAAMMQGIHEDLALVGIRHETFASERALVDAGAPDRVIERLRAAGLIYEGVLEPPKGRVPEDWEPRAQTLFRATQFGDDVDRPLRKSDGSNTYFANDIAYHADKLDRGYALLVDVLGADHGGYVKRMKAAVRALSGGAVPLDVVVCQIVRIVRGGQVVRMSKRAGTFETLRDLVEEVGRDAVRFTMLTRKSDAQMEFDLDAVVAQTRENPVFYVQYAHARCRSVLRLAAETYGAEAVAPEALADAPLDSLGADAELAVLKRLVAWPRLVSGAAQAMEPHRVAFFLYDLAGDFHMLWNRGKDDAALRFLQADRPAETRARLALVAAVAATIRSGLAVLGVEPAEEMR
jgi:arginyl-tRNA synthetase